MAPQYQEKLDYRRSRTRFGVGKIVHEETENHCLFYSDLCPNERFSNSKKLLYFWGRKSGRIRATTIKMDRKKVSTFLNSFSRDYNTGKRTSLENDIDMVLIGNL